MYFFEIVSDHHFEAMHSLNVSKLTTNTVFQFLAIFLVVTYSFEKWLVIRSMYCLTWKDFSPGGPSCARCRCHNLLWARIHCQMFLIKRLYCNKHILRYILTILIGENIASTPFLVYLMLKGVKCAP